MQQNCFLCWLKSHHCCQIMSSFLLWLNLTCMMGFVGERASSCCQLVSQTNREMGQKERRSPAPSDCLVVKPTAGASDDKTPSVNYFREGPFQKLVQRGKDMESRGYIKKWKEWVHFLKMRPCKSPFCLTSCASFPPLFGSLQVLCFPHLQQPEFFASLPTSVCMLTVNTVYGRKKITVYFIPAKMIFDGISTQQIMLRIITPTGEKVLFFCLKMVVK